MAHDTCMRSAGDKSASRRIGAALVLALLFPALPLVLPRALPLALPLAAANDPEVDPAATEAPEVSLTPFATTPEIVALAAPAGEGATPTKERLEKIIDLIFDDSAGLGFTYERRPTLTAAQAFERRRGNCISLVNLFVAMARSVDIPAVFVEVEDFEAYYRHQGAVVRSTHIVGGVPSGIRVLAVDFLPDRAKTYRRLRQISDEDAISHYLNSVATEAMLAGDNDRARKLFELALEHDPDFPETLNNQAILLRRLGDLDGAVAALERAHEIDPRFLSALENLSGFYRLQGDDVRAAAMHEQIEKLTSKNPFFLLQRGFEKLDAGDLDEAEDLLQRVSRIEPAIPETFMGLGRIELARGNQRKAERNFRKAKTRSAIYSESFQGGLQQKIDKLLADNGGS